MYTIYSKPNCGSCLQAKQLLEMEELPFEYLQLGTHYNLDELMGLFPDARTFPMIVKDGEVVGGYKDLAESLKQEY